MNKIFQTYYNSPLGQIELTGTKEGIISIMFRKDGEQTKDIPVVLAECYQQIDEYFQGKRHSFSIKYILNGTEFQNKVWAELAKIPYGETVSYKNIAEAIGNVKAIRAVGNANGKNTLNIVVPCHRVIGANGSLTGYGGGLWRKEWLINHEQKNMGCSKM